jgi:hypothetical protein
MDNYDLHRKIQRLQQRIGRVEPKEPGGIYAVGTWTPTLVGSTIAGTFTYNAVTAGSYTRIGNMVFLRGRITITVVTVAPTGNLSVRGLPFTAATITNGTPGAITPAYWGIVNIGGGAKVYLGGWIQNGATQIDLTVSDSAGGGAVFLTGAVAGIAAGSDIPFVGQYQV